MSEPDLLGLASALGRAWMEIWVLFVIVVTGLLAVVAASPQPLPKTVSKWMVGGFIVFLLTQIYAFVRYDYIFEQIHCMVKIHGKPEAIELSRRLLPPAKEVYTIYTLLGLLVAWLLWSIPEGRRTHKR